MSSVSKLTVHVFGFVLLNLKPLDSNVFLQSSNFLFTPSLVSSSKTISSANNIHHGISS
ncbi:hypothetical protein Syun_014694 [Stephania yunnanensis]|uniref:Uncharacterized protein n=1 Tax=Stephania yunnanensis TaxID=152371 RepID=A0AAP0JKA5_9MAGN